MSPNRGEPALRQQPSGRCGARWAGRDLRACCFPGGVLGAAAARVQLFRMLPAGWGGGASAGAQLCPLGPRAVAWLLGPSLEVSLGRRSTGHLSPFLFVFGSSPRPGSGSASVIIEHFPLSSLCSVHPGSRPGPPPCLILVSGLLMARVGMRCVLSLVELSELQVAGVQ